MDGVDEAAEKRQVVLVAGLHHVTEEYYEGDEGGEKYSPGDVSIACGDWAWIGGRTSEHM